MSEPTPRKTSELAEEVPVECSVYLRSGSASISGLPSCRCVFKLASYQRKSLSERTLSTTYSLSFGGNLGNRLRNRSS